jgi:hypothetical protein
MACVLWGGLAFYLTQPGPFVALMAQAASLPEHVFTLAGLRRVAGPDQAVSSFMSRLVTGVPASPAALAVDEGVLSASMRERLPAMRDLLADSGYDPLLKTRHQPEAFTVRDTKIRGDRATVTVDTRTGFETQTLGLDLVREDGAWRLDRVRLLLPPERVVDNFYSWYLYSARSGSKPTPSGVADDPRNLIADGFYGWYLYYAGAGTPAGTDAPVFTTDFAARLAQASSSDSGVDPILLTGQVPAGVAVETAVVAGDEADVYLRSDLEGHRVGVHLVQEDGLWQIADIYPAGESGQADTPTGAVAAFYAWYLSPLPAHQRTEGAYRYSDLLAPELIARLDASRGEAAADPLVCSAALPSGVSVVASSEQGDTAQVLASGGASGEAIAVELRQEDGRWLIYDVACPTP